MSPLAIIYIRSARKTRSAEAPTRTTTKTDPQLSGRKVGGDGMLYRGVARCINNVYIEMVEVNATRFRVYSPEIRFQSRMNQSSTGLDSHIISAILMGARELYIQLDYIPNERISGLLRYLLLSIMCAKIATGCLVDRIQLFGFALPGH